MQPNVATGQTHEVQGSEQCPGLTTDVLARNVQPCQGTARHSGMQRNVVAKLRRLGQPVRSLVDKCHRLASVSAALAPRLLRAHGCGLHLIFPNSWMSVPCSGTSGELRDLQKHGAAAFREGLRAEHLIQAKLYVIMN